MEESNQRRERLKAMRLEASQVDPTSNDNHLTVSPLSNPFLESTQSNTQSSPQSFNYYTNPMAAYSGNRPQISQDYSSTPQRSQTYEASPSPYPRPHINRLPNPRMHQPPRGQYPNPNYTGFSPHPRVGFPSPQTHFTRSPAHVSGQGGYPGLGPNIPNPGSGGQGGRGNWYRNEMSSGPSSGRGMGRGSGQGRWQGRGGNYVTAEDQPNRFYHKSMVEDPWKFLEPVVWKSEKKQWVPQSLAAKKPRVSESPKQSSSQPSLAEILAASFNEAKNDEPNAG